MILKVQTKKEIIFFLLLFKLAQQMRGGPTAEELLRLLDQCDLSNSLCSTPCMSPCSSIVSSAATINRLKAANVAFLNQMHSTE